MTFTHDEQTIIAAAADDVPAAVRGAQRFAAAVEKRHHRPASRPRRRHRIQHRQADRRSSRRRHRRRVRTRHLAEARTIAANRLEDAWRQKLPRPRGAVPANLDTAAAKLTDELAKLGNFDVSEVDNRHDQRFARLRGICQRLDDGRRLRACYAIENITHAGERSLSTVAVLKNGSTSAIGFSNRNGRPTGVELWIALARSEDMDRIAWQSQNDRASSQDRPPARAESRGYANSDNWGSQHASGDRSMTSSRGDGR